MTRKISRILALALLLGGSAAALAHHSFSMFDRDNQQALTGTVQRWAFNNPHVWLYIDVPGEEGEESTLWSFEGGAPPQLISMGITGSTFTPGSEVNIIFCQLVDGRPGGAIGFVKQADGTVVRPNDGGCRVGPTDVEKWQGWLAQGITHSELAPQ